MKISHAIGLLLILTAPLAAQSQQPPASVVTANPVRIFNELQETKDLIARMSADVKGMEAERLKKTSALQEAHRQRDASRPQSPQFAEQDQKLLNMSIELESWTKVKQAEMENLRKQQTKALFDKIIQAISELANARKIDLVISDQNPSVPSLEGLDLNQLKSLLNERNVLFNSGRADISKDVVAALDAKYRAGK